MKQKLIDANKLNVDYVKASTATNTMLCYISKEQVENVPTVEAIPIEWINKWLEVCTEEEVQAITVMAYAWNLDEGQKKWEKENENS